MPSGIEKVCVFFLNVESLVPLPYLIYPDALLISNSFFFYSFSLKNDLFPEAMSIGIGQSSRVINKFGNAIVLSLPEKICRLHFKWIFIRILKKNRCQSSHFFN